MASPVDRCAACADRRAQSIEDMGEKKEDLTHAAGDGKLAHNFRQPGVVRAADFDQVEVQQITKSGNKVQPFKKSLDSREAVNKTCDTCDGLAVGSTVGDVAPRPFLHMHEDRTGDRDQELKMTTEHDVTPHQRTRHTVQKVTLWQEEGHLITKSGPRGPNMSVDTLEGSGEHNPTEDKGASQTWSQDGHTRIASKLTRSSTRKGENDVNPPTSESTSGKCSYNKEISSVPTLSGTHSAEMEVHPLVRRR
ncbi:hypothetical protein SCA6_009574 [Theobroma cacao]